MKSFLALCKLRRTLQLPLPTRAFRLRQLGPDLARLPLWMRVELVSGIEPKLTVHECESLFPYQGDGHDEGWLERFVKVASAPDPPPWLTMLRSLRGSVLRQVFVS